MDDSDKSHFEETTTKVNINVLFDLPLSSIFNLLSINKYINEIEIKEYLKKN